MGDERRRRKAMRREEGEERTRWERREARRAGTVPAGGEQATMGHVGSSRAAAVV